MKLLRLFAALSFGCSPLLAATPPTDLLYGHFEIHLDYQLTPGNPDAGWKLSTSYNLSNDFNQRDQVVMMDPAATPFIASPKTRQTITPALSRFGPVGDPLWILPANPQNGTLYLGVRSLMEAGMFQARVGSTHTPSAQGSTSLRLVSVEGSGPDAGGKFATWRTDSFGALLFSFDTTNGITAADEIPTIAAATHTHYNWGFTKPGTYEVTFEASGVLNSWHPDGGTLTKARQTFTFIIPFPGEIGSGSEIRITPDLTVADPAAGVVYRPDRVFLRADTPDGSGGWRASGTLATAPLPLTDGVGVMPEDAASLPTGWSNLVVRQIHSRGPGSLSWQDENGNPLDLTGGLAIGENERRPLVTAFSETGIYRATLEVTGTYQGQSISRGPFTLTYGPGIGSDFSYDGWRTSFEKTGGLAAGALAHPLADHDGDGLTNGTEFAMFWQGLDPTIPDAHLMLLPRPTPEGHAALDFLRDLRKDPLDESAWQVIPEYSHDLSSWTGLSARTPGLPLGLFETAAEEGNARGPILKRRVRAIGAAPLPHAFFRFRILSP